MLFLTSPEAEVYQRHIFWPEAEAIMPLALGGRPKTKVPITMECIMKNVLKEKTRVNLVNKNPAPISYSKFRFSLANVGAICQ